MRAAIPKFSQLFAPLHDLLEEGYTQYNNCMETRLINGPFSAWRDENQDAFHNLVKEIKEQANLATFDPKKRLFIFTDASEP